jgi:hypothetical protein
MYRLAGPKVLAQRVLGVRAEDRKLGLSAAAGLISVILLLCHFIAYSGAPFWPVRRRLVRLGLTSRRFGSARWSRRSFGDACPSGPVDFKDVAAASQRVMRWPERFERGHRLMREDAVELRHNSRLVGKPSLTRLWKSCPSTVQNWTLPPRSTGLVLCF